MTSGSKLTAFLLTALGTCLPLSASAQEEDSLGSEVLDPSLSLDPSAPQVGALPGGTTPSFGIPPADETDWRFDFHGIVVAPLRMGLNSRDNPTPDQSDTVLHAPPVVPDDLETFSHTGTIPKPYVQLNFSYGNSIVTGTVSILARQQNVATGFFDPPSQLGVNDVFLSIKPELLPNLGLQIHVGAFSNRYGSMGEYDEGRYGQPIIGRTNGVGEHVAATIGFGDFTLLLEQGIQGQSNKAPAGLTPEGWNDFADQNVGTSFVNHVHAGVNYRRFATLGAHYMMAWSQDDRATGTLGPDGSIRVLGADLRLNLSRFGHLYVGVARTEADHARTVGRILEVLNTRGGAGLMEHYIGENSNGNGELVTVGAQYDLSIGKLVSYPVPFSGDGPDLFVSLFGMQTSVTSEDPAQHGKLKRKLGFEGTYSFLSWLAASLRYDRVDPNVDDQRESFAVVSPRLIFRTDWQATDQVVLQYSRWLYGSTTRVRTGYPPREDVTATPDADTLTLTASMWW
ncbi:MAG TPA: hypothetical protein VKY73_00930 [Polyangiaceae bacterium]|nr:hypothetical protein [Polyangiaceae bacterium]